MTAGRLAISQSSTTRTTKPTNATRRAIGAGRPSANARAKSLSAAARGVQAMSVSIKAADAIAAVCARRRRRWYRVAFDSFIGLEFPAEAPSVSRLARQAPSVELNRNQL